MDPLRKRIVEAGPDLGPQGGDGLLEGVLVEGRSLELPLRFDGAEARGPDTGKADDEIVEGAGGGVKARGQGSAHVGDGVGAVSGVLVAFDVGVAARLGDGYRHEEGVLGLREARSGDLDVFLALGRVKVQGGPGGDPDGNEVAVGVEADDAAAQCGVVSDLGVGEVAALVRDRFQGRVRAFVEGVVEFLDGDPGPEDDGVALLRNALQLWNIAEERLPGGVLEGVFLEVADVGVAGDKLGAGLEGLGLGGRQVPAGAAPDDFQGLGRAPVFLGKHLIEALGALVVLPPLGDPGFALEGILAEDRSGIENGTVAGAAAEVAVVEALQVLLGEPLAIVEPGLKGHDEARGTEAALGRAQLAEGVADGMDLVLGEVAETLDGGDVGPVQPRPAA